MHEIAERLVLRGHKITLITAAFPGCKRKNETIDGVEIIRSGGRYTVYLKAPQLYGRHAGGYDIVMDESTTLKTTSKSSKGTRLVFFVSGRFYHAGMNLDESHQR